MTPDFQIFLLPLLETLKDGEVHSEKDSESKMIKYIELTDEALKPPGLEKDERLIQQAVALAKEHLLKAGLVECANPDQVKITALGKLVLSKKLNSLDVAFLSRLPGYRTGGA